MFDLDFTKEVQEPRLDEYQKEEFDEAWNFFESDTGHRTPTMEVINKFWMFLNLEGYDYTVKELTLWLKSYFIADSISWLEEK